MKKIRLIGVCILALGLSACSSDNSDVDTLLDGFEDEKIDLGITNEWDGVNYTNLFNEYGETTEGFYYVDFSKNTMMYISKKAETALPLCTKVECVHGEGFEDVYEDMEGYSYKCNSTYVSGTGVQVYNGKLYADTVYSTADAQVLLCCELDGTGKKEAISNINTRIDEESKKQNNGQITMTSLDWTIADDKVYVLTEIHIEKGSSVIERVYLDEYGLESGELEKALFYKEYNVLDMTTSYLYVSKDNVYMGMYMAVMNVGDTYNLIQINRETGDCTEIDFGQDREYKGYTFAEDKILFGKKNGDVYTYDVYGNEVKCIELNETEKEIGMYYKMCGDYIFITTREAVETESGTKEYYTKIYDREYKYLDTVYHKANLLAVAGGTNQLLFRGRGSDVLYYINVDEIGTGNIELKSIEIQKVTSKATEKAID